MGNAILTSLNSMTNPPSDLNEIDSGWRFFKCSIPSVSKTYSIAKGDVFSDTHKNEQILNFKFPFSASGIAIMLSTAGKSLEFDTSAQANLSSAIKPWPSNPTTDNILNQTTYPLIVIYDGNVTRSFAQKSFLVYEYERNEDYYDYVYLEILPSNITISRSGVSMYLTTEFSGTSYHGRPITPSTAAGGGNQSVRISGLSCYGWYLPG